jgi:hypothetical protein
VQQKLTSPKTLFWGKGQEAQFASRKASRSQTTIEYKAKYTAAEWGLK